MTSNQKSKTYHGREAVRKVREVYGDAITPLMVPIILAEGYSEGRYLDTKGIPTYGVGQTARYSHLPFPEVFNAKLQQLTSVVKDYDHLPRRVQEALILAHYRGDWFGSPQTARLFSLGKYEEAAKEFLDNDEYRSSVINGPDGIKKRFETIAKALASMA